MRLNFSTILFCVFVPFVAKNFCAFLWLKLDDAAADTNRHGLGSIVGA